MFISTEYGRYVNVANAAIVDLAKSVVIMPDGESHRIERNVNEDDVLVEFLPGDGWELVVISEPGDGEPIDPEKAYYFVPLVMIGVTLGRALVPYTWEGAWDGMDPDENGLRRIGQSEIQVPGHGEVASAADFVKLILNNRARRAKWDKEREKEKAKKALKAKDKK